MSSHRAPAMTLARGLVAATLVAISPSGALAAPRLDASSSSLQFTAANNSYTVAAGCDLSQPLVFVNGQVRNVGTTVTDAYSIIAADDAGALSGQQALLPLEPGAAIDVAIPLRHIGPDTAGITGPHLITLSLGLRALAKLPVMVPQALCGSAAVAAAGADGSVRSRQRRPTPVVSGSASKLALARTTTTARSNLSAVLVLAAPANLRAANGNDDCFQHANGVYWCPDHVGRGDYMLVWDWPAPIEISGYRVYRVDRGSKELVAEQDHGKDVTIAFFATHGGKLWGQCFAVSAFNDVTESAPSQSFCSR